MNGSFFVENNLGLFKKLLEVQSAVPDLIKARDANAGKFKWQFIPLEDIYNEVQPVFAQHGLFLFWYFDTEGTGNNTVHDRFEDVVTEYPTMQYLNCAVVDVESGANIISTMALPIEAFQESGKRITYYLGRMVLGFIGRVAEKDTGGEEEAEDIAPRGRSRGKSAAPRGRTRPTPQDEFFEDDEHYAEDDAEEEEAPPPPRRSARPSSSLPTRHSRR